MIYSPTGAVGFHSTNVKRPYQPSCTIPSVMLSTKETELNEQIQTLEHDKKDIKSYSDRITKELKRYQLAYPYPKYNHEADELPPPWSSSLHMLSPLLSAYDDRISELQTAVDRKDREVVGLVERLRNIVNDNEIMSTELNNKTELLSAVYKDMSTEGIPTFNHSLFFFNVFIIKYINNFYYK
eukprot:GHVR01178966.1.p1 GENE.GHVR01178966.1~~GHVR01178966.1.p1  ORF type:complete len:183 (+),score=45.50 GHVR01178966.1:177-725(+)